MSSKHKRSQMGETKLGAGKPGVSKAGLNGVAKVHKAPVHKRVANHNKTWAGALVTVVAVVVVGWLVMQSAKNSGGQVHNPVSASAIQIGERSPALKLAASSGENISLDQYRGQKVILYFYETAG